LEHGSLEFSDSKTSCENENRLIGCTRISGAVGHESVMGRSAGNRRAQQQTASGAAGSVQMW